MYRIKEFLKHWQKQTFENVAYFSRLLPTFLTLLTNQSIQARSIEIAETIIPYYLISHQILWKARYIGYLSEVVIHEIITNTKQSLTEKLHNSDYKFGKWIKKSYLNMLVDRRRMDDVVADCHPQTFSSREIRHILYHYFNH